MQKAIIIDLDDCLFDSSPMKEYYPTDENSRKQWDKFGEHYTECLINKWCKEIVEHFSDYYILFVTSREARNNAIKDTLESLGFGWWLLLLGFKQILWGFAFFFFFINRLLLFLKHL